MKVLALALLLASTSAYATTAPTNRDTTVTRTTQVDRDDDFDDWGLLGLLGLAGLAGLLRRKDEHYTTVKNTRDPRV